ncbi:Imm63 family immunity protein [Agromyces sp. MMS24-K17]|uniref:Imm63 family immunity protein n=1 Tax=Agromyces sp. MMS24-K17 TaxID=3372850 RepID=UPI003754BAA9
MTELLAELGRWYDRLERITGATITWKIDDVNRDSGYPYLEVDERGYHYCVRERNVLLREEVTRDLDELLYWVMDSHVHEIAVDAGREARGGPPGFTGDTRRLWFPEWEALMARLSPAWGERTHRRIDEILSRAPYHD